ncbi:MAG TPA: SLC13 family permease [Gammaproteobacteria bacterium]|nr:SLC13 family permease [Gammaproteobacteria bacterium]
MSRHGYSLRRDTLLWTLLAVFVLFSALHPARMVEYPGLVDWPTIATLTGLLLITAGIEESGFLHALAVRILRVVPDERRLALFLLAASALLASLLTNDIALFIVVPLTLSLRRHAVLPVGRLVIFEAFAVNTGSMLTPIGNPQNIFLWQTSGVHFHEFVWGMAPAVLVAGSCLALFTWSAFHPRPLRLKALSPSMAVRRPMLYVSALLFLPFLVLADLRHAGLALLMTTLVFLVFYHKVLQRLDWPLLLVFVLMFVDLRLFGELSWVQALLGRVDLGQPLTLFGTGALLSQVMSNVPATILLSQYSHDWRSLAWGADVGGFGLVIGSLANLIALRLGRQPGGFWAFHAWSLPFFLCTALGTGLWLAVASG